MAAHEITKVLATASTSCQHLQINFPFYQKKISQNKNIFVFKIVKIVRGPVVVPELIGRLVWEHFKVLSNDNGTKKC